MAKYLRAGKTIELITVLAVVAGTLSLKAGKAAFAVADYAAGALAAFQIEGVVTVGTSATEAAGSIGSLVYYDSSEEVCTLVPVSDAGDFVVGTLVLATDALSAAGTFEVLLNAFPADLPAGLFAGKIVDYHVANYTLDAQDTGKVLVMNADAKVFTLPATVAGLEFVIQCITADGGALMSVSPNASDKIMGPDVAGVDDKDYQLTKATQNQGDYLHIVGDGASGWFVKSSRGTWTQE